MAFCVIGQGSAGWRGMLASTGNSLPPACYSARSLSLAGREVEQQLLAWNVMLDGLELTMSRLTASERSQTLDPGSASGKMMFRFPARTGFQLSEGGNQDCRRC